MKHKYCNQYRHTCKFSYKQAFVTGLFLAVPVLGIANALFPLHSQASENIKLDSPIASEQSRPVVRKGTPALIATPSAQLQEEIEGYIKKIFHGEARVAIAVQHVECNPKNKAYPKCIYKTEREYSCGIFQINLKAHWDKVPEGNTFEEKCEYLNNPYNNVLIAKSIYSDSNWYPWAGYTSNRYLAHLND